MFCDPVVRDASKTGRRAASAEAPAAPLMAHAFDRRSLLQELRSKGIRLTAQRRAVVEVIQEACEHLDAAELLQRARAKGAKVDGATTPTLPACNVARCWSAPPRCWTGSSWNWLPAPASSCA